MQSRREGGFTLGELLALVAVIGVLAAMLVPVCERQRESARSLTCISNQQRIVSAIRMYAADNDNALPPDEHRPEVIAYFDTCPGGGWYDWQNIVHCNRAPQANPYLRWPVVLDSYLPNREVWRCPSAAVVAGARWIVPGPDWFGYLVTHAGEWGKVTIDRSDGPCLLAFPPGWGGEVTDSLVQGRLAVEPLAPLYGKVAPGAFVQSIGNPIWPDLRLSEVAAPERFVIVADGGVQAVLGVGTTAYPEICALDCGNEACGNHWGRWVDWEGCPWATGCGLYRHAPSNGSFLRNPSLRAPYARHRAPFVSSGPLWTRNGVNITFLDGHSQWIASETLIEKVKQGELGGINHSGPTQDCGFAERYPGVPTIY